MTPYDVAIVGGGFSGAMVAAHLARSGVPHLSVAVFEKGELGRGAAYGTACPEHLLNTRARAMSALDDDPDHFVRWLSSRAGCDDFVSRRLYGDYVVELIGPAFEREGFSQIRDRVVAVRRGDSGFTLAAAAGTRAAARCVVLATGNAPPNDDAIPAGAVAHPGYVADPWRFDYRRIGGRVLLVGSGLSALDVLVSLEAAGYRGSVDVVSRRGRFPEGHVDGLPVCDAVPVLDTSSARAALRSFRRAVAGARARGIDWRAVVDAIRPECETLWKRLAPAEQRRFDRHLRGRWERHRHRAPQRADAVRARYRSNGRLAVHPGRLVAFACGRATVESARGERIELHPDWIVNCTGPGRSARLFEDPLLAGLLDEGLASREPLGLGIRVDAGLAALDPNGEPVEGLWVAGPLARGTRFEATAVPELRVMARTVAAAVSTRLKKAAPPGRRLLGAEAII